MAKDLSMNITFDKSQLESIVREVEQRIAESCLTREQAIERIRDIKDDKHIHHITWGKFDGCRECTSYEVGAINELMAIFDIKEEEL